MNKSIRFIAETDEFGNVLWLWRLKPGDRMARPVRDLTSLDLELKTCVTEEAPLEAVLAFFDARKIEGRAVAAICDLISGWPSRDDIATQDPLIKGLGIHSTQILYIQKISNVVTVPVPKARLCRD